MYRFPRRRHKYNAIRTEVDGVSFASKKEAKRWGELQMLERAGKITELRRQVRCPLIVNDVLIGHYLPDFVYQENGKTVAEDVKSEATMTPLAKWKMRHFAAQYGFDVRVT